MYVKRIRGESEREREEGREKQVKYARGKGNGKDRRYQNWQKCPR